MTYHEHVATEDSVATIRRAEGEYVSDVPAAYHLATRHAATLTPATEYATLAGEHPAWEPDQAVTAGDKRAHDGHLFECIQPHTTQADWTPDETPALWKRVPAEGVIWDWVQSLGAHDALPLGFVVRHAGSMWESLVDANVWEPGTDASLWRDLSAPEEPEQPPEWKQPQGAHDAHQTGDEVTHPDRANTMGEGSTTVWVWRSKIDANTAEPGQDGHWHRWREPVRVA